MRVILYTGTQRAQMSARSTTVVMFCLSPKPGSGALEGTLSGLGSFKSDLLFRFLLHQSKCLNARFFLKGRGKVSVDQLQGTAAGTRAALG